MGLRLAILVLASTLGTAGHVGAIPLGAGLVRGGTIKFGDAASIAGPLVLDRTALLPLPQLDTTLGASQVPPVVRAVPPARLPRNARSTVRGVMLGLPEMEAALRARVLEVLQATPARHGGIAGAALPAQAPSAPDSAASGGDTGVEVEALRSAVDGADPWAVLGALTGDFTANVAALESDCTYGPEVPFDYWRFPGLAPFEPFAQSYVGTLEQRGGEIVFELGEGLVFARVEGDRLIDVVRVGAEGVTRFHDGFAVAQTAAGFLISGESAWTFEGNFWWQESCHGRTSVTLERSGDAPAGAARDLQFVLRWPVNSNADLDLMVESAASSSLSLRSVEDRRAFLGEVQSRCHVLHSAGTAGASDDANVVAWIRPLRETDLPYHEEIIRCASGSYGTWSLDVVNWSGDETVDFEVEAFEGPSIGVDRTAERELGLIELTVVPHSRRHIQFNYVPPPSVTGAGAVVNQIRRVPVPRPRDPISGSVLGFNKAAALGIPYDEFLRNVGL